MKKNILLSVFMIAMAVICNSQSRPDAVLIRLQSKLPTLQGRQLVDTLNRIARIRLGNTYDKWDSALYYSRLSIKEAKKINYGVGLFRAYLNYGDGNLQFQRAKEGEGSFKLAMQVAKELKNDTMYAVGSRRLGQAFWYLGEFDSAINIIQSSLLFFEKGGERMSSRVSDCYETIVGIYGDKGDYEKAFEFVQRHLKLSREKNDSVAIAQSTLVIGLLYLSIGDYNASFDNIKLASTYLEPCNTCYTNRFLNMCYGNLYTAKEQFDSALYFYNKAYKENPTSTLTQFYIAEAFLGLKKYDTALSMLKNIDAYQKKYGEGARAMQYKNVIASTYFGMKNYDKALLVARQGLEIGLKTGTPQYFSAGYKLLSSIFKELKKPDSALFYFEKYVLMKDSVTSDKLKGKLFEYKRIAEDEKKQSQLELFKKEKQISEEQMKQKAQLKNFIILGLIGLLLIGIFVFRNLTLKRKNTKLRVVSLEHAMKMQQLENEKKQSELRQLATELEMQALRAQMNPHFIFNCLSSINKFILKNETEAASDYLTRFSRLIRMVLINSQKSLITLEDELEMLRLYLDMERLRFKNSFEYNIHFKNTVDAGSIYLPPLLLQPFCENAIWHGLMHKEGQGVLDIAMTMQDNILNCTITDNGVGREMAAELNSKSAEKEKSLGLKITAGRLELLNRNNGAQTSYTIEDLYDENKDAAGTKVTVQIKYKNSVEEPVGGVNYETGRIVP